MLRNNNKQLAVRDCSNTSKCLMQNKIYIKKIFCYRKKYI